MTQETLFIILLEIIPNVLLDVEQNIDESAKQLESDKSIK